MSLTDLETELEARWQRGDGPSSPSEAERVRVLLTSGPMLPSLLAVRLRAFPAIAWGLLRSLPDGPELWRHIERAMGLGAPLRRGERQAIRGTFARAADRFGFEPEGRTALLVREHGVERFGLRIEVDGVRLTVDLRWYGPRPVGLALSLWNESLPWEEPLRVPLETGDFGEASEPVRLEVELGEPLPAGRYEVWIVVLDTEASALDREGKAALASGSRGRTEDLGSVEIEARPIAAALESRLADLPDEHRRRRRQAIGTALAESGDVAGAFEIIAATEGAPSRSHARELRGALIVALRERAHQAGLLGWAGVDAARIRRLVALGLPAAGISREVCLGAELGAWLEHGRERGLMLAIHSGATGASAEALGELVGEWGEADLSSGQIGVIFEGHDREYSLRIHQRDETGIQGTLTAADEEELEVTILIEEGGSALFPTDKEPLLRCGCGALVSDLREPHDHGKGKARQGVPVRRDRAASVSLRVPRRRPGAKALTIGMADARRLALSCSRKPPVGAGEDLAVAALLDFEGPLLDPMAYGRAMLAWAIPLGAGDDVLKRRLWSIDREAGGLAELTTDGRAQAMEAQPPGIAGLLEGLVSAFEQPPRGEPAPLAVEKKLLGLAVLARLSCRGGHWPEDTEAVLAQLEGLAWQSCPGLLLHLAGIVELILSEAGTR